MMSEMEIFLIETRSSDWPQGVWEATNSAYSNLEAAKTWAHESPDKWKLTKGGWQMRRKYLNSQYYQTARIRRITLHIENYAPLFADVIKGANS